MRKSGWVVIASICNSNLAALALALLCVMTCHGQAPTGLVDSVSDPDSVSDFAPEDDSADWNFFRGNRFDGTSGFSGIADSWDEKGPPVFWSIELGQGYSGFVGSTDRVVTQYQSLTGQFVVCLDAKTGEKIWEHRYGWPYQPASLYPGPRSTPTIAGQRVFYTSPTAEVGCLDLKTGNPIWKFSLAERFDSPEVEFGFACSPVISKGRLLIPAGGKDASMVALDPETGETIWASGDRPVSYCSALPIRFEDRDLVVGYFKNDIAIFDFESGEPLGFYPISDGYDEHSAWPVYREPFLWASGPFRAGCSLFELETVDDQIRLTPVYRKKIMSNDVASSVLIGESLFGFDIRDVQSKVHRPSRGQFICIDRMTGDVRWQNGSLARRQIPDEAAETISSDEEKSESDIGHASLIVADGKLLMLNDTGTLIIAHADEDEYREIGRWNILGGEIIWTAPSLIGPFVMARNHSRAVCVYVGEPELQPVVISESPVQYAGQIEQPVFYDLAPIVLGTEPKYAMTAPPARWLVRWFLISLVFGWGVAPAIALLIAKMTGRIPARGAFLTIAFLFGVFGTTIAGRWFGMFYFSWPVAMAILFECLVCRIQGSPSQTKFDPWIARLVLLIFLVCNILYFWLCRRLSLAFEWSFLIGFPAAVPFLWVIKRRVQRAEPFSVFQWVFSAFAFTAFYWLGAGIMIAMYGVH